MNRTDLVKEDSYSYYKNLICEWMRRNASETAISCFTNVGRIREVKYARLASYIQGFSKLKYEYGFRDGDRVLLLESDIADSIVAFSVLTCNHLTVVPVDVRIPTEELVKIIDSVQISAIFTDRKNFPIIKDRHEVPVFQSYGLDRKFMLLQEASAPFAPSMPTPDTAAVIFSSGTTSRMKAIEVTYESLYLSAKRKAAAAGLSRQNKKQLHVVIYPTSHISGISAVSEKLLCGIPILTLGQMNIDALSKAFIKFNPTTFGIVARVLAIFIDRMEDNLKKKHIYGLYMALRWVSAFFRKRFGCKAVGRILMTPFRWAVFGKNMQFITSGGTPAIPRVTSAILDMGITFINYYASTECGVPIVCTDWSDRYPVETVGNVKHDPNVEVVIHDPDEDGIGEIYVRSRYIMNGYYGDPLLTKQTFDGEYFKTGDNGRIDEEGYLYIAGRCKDSIILSSGKKVAPDDLELMLMPVIGQGMEFSVVGVPNEQSACDTIHIFVVEASYDSSLREMLKSKIFKWQRNEAVMYPIEEIHFIDALPKTSIGKVKRAELCKLAANNSEKDMLPSDIENIEKLSLEDGIRKESSEAILEKINRIVKRIGGIDNPLTGLENLKDDLGLDSLSLFEICTEIEAEFGVSIAPYLYVLPNVQEIADYVRDPFIINAAGEVKTQRKKTKKQNAYDYLGKRGVVHHLVFILAGHIISKIFGVHSAGLDNVKADEAYIICPNHQTTHDPLFVWNALGSKRPSYHSLGCLAKEELFHNEILRFCMVCNGAIPVERTGNTTISFKRSIEFLRAGNTILVHPEGTRTKTGRLGEFKEGAALMSVETGVKILPVAIKGGFEMLPPGTVIPRLWNKKTKRRNRVQIVFCKPIDPVGKSVEQLTAEMKEAIWEKETG